MWIVFAVLACVALIVLTRRTPSEPAVVSPAPTPARSIEPHASFDGGDRYATETERALDGSDAECLGEGLLMALVDALRARGVGTNPIEPESYGYMTVVEIGGEDVILQIGAGGDQDWILYVKAPSGKVPSQIVDALHSLEDLRNVTWSA